jgi:hypothetical protein
MVDRAVAVTTLSTAYLDKTLLQMDKIIVRRSTVGWLIVMAIALSCIIRGVTRLNHHASGGYLLIFTGLIVLASALFQLLMTGPRVIIDEEGISGMWMGNIKIPWEKIQRADLKYVPRSDPVITGAFQVGGDSTTTDRDRNG